MTMQVIEHIEVGSGGAASIEFTSISAGHTDLYLSLSLRQSAGSEGAGFSFRLNGSTLNFSQRRLYGTGSSAVTDTGAESLWVVGNGATANTFSNSSIYIPNYASSSAKSYSNDGVSENNASTAFQAIVAGLWNDTNAITSLGIYCTAGSFVQYSSATLYGITAGSDGSTTVS